MKILIKNTVPILTLLVEFSAAAQSPAHVSTVDKESKVIELTHTLGEFNQSELKLEAGEPYIFAVTNRGVDHEVGFEVAPKGKTEQKDHIKSAYVTKTVKKGDTQMSNEVILEAGKYVFFCPMNTTPHYSITVK